MTNSLVSLLPLLVDSLLDGFTDSDHFLLVEFLGLFSVFGGRLGFGNLFRARNTYVGGLRRSVDLAVELLHIGFVFGDGRSGEDVSDKSPERFGGLRSKNGGRQESFKSWEDVGGVDVLSERSRVRGDGDLSLGEV